MKSENLLMVLGLGLRAAEAVLSRRQSGRRKSDQPASRVERAVNRMVPLAHRALDRVTPARRRRGPSALGLASSAVLGAATAGVAAYVVRQEQQRIRDRYRPLRAPFDVELLDVLSAPGGGGRLEYSGSQLVDRHSGATYTLIDGIPDFIAPVSAVDQLDAEQTWLTDLARPLAMRILGRNSTGNAAFASAVAAAAGTGWALSVPSGRGTYELEMARANPRARVLCISNDWDTLLEVRRRANAAGLTNLYFARGLARLLPLQDCVLGGVWTGGGLDRFPKPERELTQMIRVAQPGAPVAGVSLVRGGPRYLDLMLRLGARRLPGVRSLTMHLALLQAAGLRDVRLFRDGGFVRFSGVRVDV